MWVFLVNRISRTIITLLLAVTVIFFAIRGLPGGPAEALLGRHMTEGGIADLKRQMGLDRPLWEQYLGYVGSVVQGDFGRSLSLGKPVTAMVLEVVPFTGSLVVGALLIGILIGIPLGIISAVNRNGFLDYAIRLISLAGISLPGFVIAILLMLPLSVYLGWFPMVGGGGPSYPNILYFAFLPALAGGLGMSAYLTRLTRSTVLEILTEDYIRTARSKGVRESVVLFKHTLRNALVVIVTFLGLYAVILVGDSIAIELVFSRPGFGRLILGGVDQRDYALLQSVLLLYVAFSAFVNLMVDLFYAVLDPRIRLSARQD